MNWPQRVVTKIPFPQLLCSPCRRLLVTHLLILQESLRDVRIHLLRLVQPIPVEEGNRYNVPSHRRQQPIAQAGVAERLERISGKVRRAIELDCNAPVHNREIYAVQPICRDVLQLMQYA